MALCRLWEPHPVRRRPHPAHIGYWHFDLAGEHAVEDVEVKAESVEAVTCRWCGRSDSVELVDRADASDATDPAAG